MMVSNLTNIKGLCEAFWTLEEELGLLEFEIDGVKVWQLRRFELYYEVAQKIGILGQPHSKGQRRPLLKSGLQLFKNVFIHNPFLSPPQKNLVFPHSRVQKVDGKHIDIYTHYFIRELSMTGTSFCSLKQRYLGQYIGPFDAYSFSMDFIELTAWLLQRVDKLNASPTQKEYFRKLDGRFADVFGIRFNTEDYFALSVVFFRAYHRILTLLLRRIRPEKIYMVVGYMAQMKVLTQAAKNLGIPVYEFQHGTFSKYHLGYSYPGRKRSLEYFPDYFLVWSRFWKNMAIDLPIKRENIIIDGYRHLGAYKRSNVKINKVKKRAVVISQGAIGEKLSEKIARNWEIFQEFDIRYKLHPGEYDRWRDYPALKDLVSQGRVVLKKDCDLYDLFMASEYQIGVFSTALYEGVEFGCKTILINLPGIEYMDSFIWANKDLVTIVQ